MPNFSARSAGRLSQCHPDLQTLFNTIVKHFDCTIITGHRTETEQEDMFSRSLSQLHFPQSKHNQQPSLAVDAAPYPIDWEDRERFSYFAGQVKGLALSMGIKLRWGGDWDDDTRLGDNRFDDLPHFELVL